MALVDLFANWKDNVSDPARRAFLIVPHDDNELAVLPKAIRANTAGTITYQAVNSSFDVTMNVVAGERLDVRPKYVRAAGTTAVVHGFA